MVIEKDFTELTEILFEKSIAIDDTSYLVIYGMHINGGFICIPNHNIGCEASYMDYSTDFNQEKLIKAGMAAAAAEEIAAYIDNWLKDNKELMEKKRAAAQQAMIKRLNLK